jgi:hypothetical protein
MANFYAQAVVRNHGRSQRQAAPDRPLRDLPLHDLEELQENCLFVDLRLVRPYHTREQRNNFLRSDTRLVQLGENVSIGRFVEEFDNTRCYFRSDVADAQQYFFLCCYKFGNIAESLCQDFGYMLAYMSDAESKYEFFQSRGMGTLECRDKIIG